MTTTPASAPSSAAPSPVSAAKTSASAPATPAAPPAAAPTPSSTTPAAATQPTPGAQASSAAGIASAAAGSAALVPESPVIDSPASATQQEEAGDTHDGQQPSSSAPSPVSAAKTSASAPATPAAPPAAAPTPSSSTPATITQPTPGAQASSAAGIASAATGSAASVPESSVVDSPASATQQEEAGDTHDGPQPSSSGAPPLAPPSPALRALADLLPDPATLNAEAPLLRQPTLNAEAPLLRQRLLDEASRRALALIRPAGALPTLLDLPGVSADAMPLTTDALVAFVCEPQRVFRALASAYGASQLDARTLATVDALRWATHAVLQLARDLCSAHGELQQLRASDAGSLAAVTAELAEERRQLETVSSERDALRRQLAVVSRERDELRQQLADANAKCARNQLDARTLATVDALRWATHAVLQLARDLCSAHGELQQLRASDAGSLAAVTAELAEERQQLETVSSERDALRRQLAVISRERDELRQQLADANAKCARKSARRLEEAGAHQAVVARLNSEMTLLRAGLRRHESASRELAELRAAVASRLGTVDEVADFWRDELRQQLADANAKCARKSARRLEEAGAHQAVVARLNSEMTLLRVGLRRHESASRELAELRAAVASRLGTVDEVADFWVSHAQSSNIDPAVLRFALEACRRRRSEGWSQVLFMAMTLPGQSLPTLPPADIQDPPPGSGPTPTPSVPPREPAPLDLSSPRGSSSSKALPRRADRMRALSRPTGADVPAEEPAEEPAGSDADVPMGSEGSEPAEGEPDVESEAGDDAEPSEAEEGEPAGSDGGDDDEAHELGGDDDWGEEGDAELGDDEPSEGEEEAIEELALDASAAKRSAAGAGIDSADPSGTGKRARHLPSSSPPPSPARDAGTSGPSDVSGRVVPRLGAGESSGYRVVIDPAWSLRQRYAAVRKSFTYKNAWGVAARRAVRSPRQFPLIPTDLAFAAGVVMGVSTTLPPTSESPHEGWRSSVNGWPVQRMVKLPERLDHVTYPNYLIAKSGKLSGAARYIESFGPGGEAHLLNLLRRAPWDEMWASRVRRLYLLDLDLLDDADIRWVKTYLFFMYTHRQAMWEHYHWLAAPRADRGVEGFARAPSQPTAGLTLDDPNALAPHLAAADHEEPLRIQFSGCPHRLIESLGWRNQIGFQLHHHAGVSWEVPAPWNDPAYGPAPRDTRFAGTPGAEFYFDSFPASLLEAFDRRVRGIRELMRLTGSSAKQQAVGGDDPRAKLRRLLLTPLTDDDEEVPAPASTTASAAPTPA
ncbi:hypothetical protein ATCC90586_008982 [Pythium insidiosum]|nr:hypothetical protein ATCC90586_008982 [Pythium insidiosum]